MAKETKPLMIFLAGTLYSSKNLKKKIKERDFDFYGADGGILLAENLNLSLKRVLGDFDSVSKPFREDVMIYPKEKDETDALLALELAIREGYDEIWMIAPFGGRVDHTIANLSLLEKAQQSKVDLYLYDGYNFARLLREGTHLFSDDFHYYSFFAWKNDVIVSLKGFKYPLDQYCLSTSNSIGISNEAAEKSPTVIIHKGQVLSICIEE